MNCKECNNTISVRSRSGLCKKHYGYLWKSLNRERAALHSKITYSRNKEFYIKTSSARRILARKLNPQVSIRDSLRRRLNNALKNKQKSGSAIKDLGCTIVEFMIHIESKFQLGMSWDNYGKWHIDHIKPLSKFDLTKRAELLEACHYSNLQPLWAKDNLSKGSK